MAAKITYWGYGSLKIVTDAGTTVLVDPVLTHNPAAPTSAGQVERADLILVTHLHWDHVGDSIPLAQKTGAILAGASESMLYARWLGIPKEQTRNMSPGGRRFFGDVTVQALEARHGSYAQTPDGRFVSGLALSFILLLPTGERLYLSGDTALFSDMKLIAELYRPNVAAFAIGAVPGGGSHISVYESALACQWLGVQVAIPIHYDNPQEAVEFREHLARLSPKASVVVLEPGETYEARFDKESTQ